MPALLLGASLLTACGGGDSAALVAEARAMLKLKPDNPAIALMQLKPNGIWLMRSTQTATRRARQELKILWDRRVSFVAGAEARSLYQQLTATS